MTPFPTGVMQIARFTLLCDVPLFVRPARAGRVLADGRCFQ